MEIKHLDKDNLIAAVEAHAEQAKKNALESIDYHVAEAKRTIADAALAIPAIPQDTALYLNAEAVLTSRIEAHHTYRRDECVVSIAFNGGNHQNLGVFMLPPDALNQPVKRYRAILFLLPVEKEKETTRDLCSPACSVFPGPHPYSSHNPVEPEKAE